MNNTVETQSVTSLNSLYDQILVNGTLLMNRVQTVAKKLDVYCCLLYTCILYGIGKNQCFLPIRGRVSIEWIGLSSEQCPISFTRANS